MQSGKQVALSFAELSTAVADQRKTREIPEFGSADVTESARKPQVFASKVSSTSDIKVCARLL
jgi:hypothetical protein